MDYRSWYEYGVSAKILIRSIGPDTKYWTGYEESDPGESDLIRRIGTVSENRTGYGESDQIRRIEPAKGNRTGYRESDRIRRIEPDYRLPDRIRRIRPDTEHRTGYWESDRIRIARPDTETLTGYGISHGGQLGWAHPCFACNSCRRCRRNRNFAS